MTILPIVTRELRMTARQGKTYWSRTGVAAVMLLAAAWVFVISHRETSAAQASAIFGTLAGGMVFVGAVSGMGATADSLSSEKREGTLGLLFLTPLRGYDVVLGKLCAGSLTVLYGLLGVTPILALPLLMGGVSPMEFARMALLMLNTMLLSLNVGICISSISRNEKRARAVALGVMILFAAGFPLIGGILEGEFRLRGVAEWLLLFSPGYTFWQAWDKSRAIPGAGFWASMLTLHVMTWLFLALACWFTPRTWQDRSGRKPFRLTGLSSSNGKGDSRAAVLRGCLLDQNAFLWLSGRSRFKRMFVWATLITLTGCWLTMGMKYPRDFFSAAMFVVVALAWNGVLKTWVASEATRQIASDRKSGSIELLLSTPLTTRDITNGLWLALQRQFGGPLLAVLLGECLLMMLGVREVARGEERLMWMAIWLCGMTLLVVDILAMYAVGLWQSAVAKGPTEAAGATAFQILALPWILYLLLLALVAVADATGTLGNVPGDEWFWFLGAWFLIGLGVDCLFGLRAWRLVRNRFREAASMRGGRHGLWHALGRLFGTVRSRVQE